MEDAIKEAILAQQRKSVPVGAVIVHNQQIIAAAGNEVIKNKNPLCHAEILAINKACKILQTHILDQCDIFVSLEPCAMCAQAISLAKIRRLYFGAYNPRYGAVVHNAKVLDYAVYKPEVIGGIMETKCLELLHDFFKNIRQKDY